MEGQKYKKLFLISEVYSLLNGIQQSTREAVGSKLEPVMGETNLVKASFSCRCSQGLLIRDDLGLSLERQVRA